jgi:peroxiredoxin
MKSQLLLSRFRLAMGICIPQAVLLLAGFFLFAIGMSFPSHACAQTQEDGSKKEAKAISDQIHHLRDLADDVRARTTKQLAIDIRRLPASMTKLSLASALANYSTEGDFGRDTLQEVVTTLADALREQPQRMSGNEPAAPYFQLAQLVHYEQVQTSLDSPQLAAATARIEADDEIRRNADFTLSDLQGKSWTLRALRGKVVLVNFWATWCPPCRKEMPDLDALYQRFKDRGFVVLAISDEDAGKVKGLLAEKGVSFPILLDPGRKVNELFRVGGIPKSFLYDRDGKLVAQAIDMRTQGQFLKMLAQAGLH